MRSVAVPLLAVAELGLAALRPAHSQTITFDNRSGEPASVRVIGPSKPTADVPNGEHRTVVVKGGQYYILVRYGLSSQFRYARGDPFRVTRTATQYSVITITLHPVLNGNYGSQPITAKEFDDAH